MFSSNTASSRARKGINSFGVDSKRQQNMVKLPTGKITEEEARSLFECYVGGCVRQDLAQAQSNSICKAKVLLSHFVNTKALGAEASLITNTKPTKMVPLQGKRPLCLKVWRKPKSLSACGSMPD